MLQEFDFELRYHKGQYNAVANTLSRATMVNYLSFTLLKSDFLESPKGTFESNPHYSQVWQAVQKRKPSSLNSTLEKVLGPNHEANMAIILDSSHEPLMMSDERFDGKTLPLIMGIYSIKVKYVY